MRNKLSDLNDHLFAELERLGDETMTDDELVKEIDRAKAISGVAAQVVSNANLVLRAHMAAVEWEGTSKKKMPLLLE
jgi:uncharacterized membrane protein